MIAPEPRPLRDDEACEWLVTYPPSMRQRQTNYVYTRAEAEAKFGPGWCEPVLATRVIRKPPQRFGLYPNGGGVLSHELLQKP